MRGEILLSICLSHPHDDALHQSENDEHLGIFISRHSEDDHYLSETDPSTAASEPMSSWSHPASSFPSAEPAGHSLGRIYLPRVFYTATSRARGSSRGGRAITSARDQHSETHGFFSSGHISERSQDLICSSPTSTFSTAGGRGLVFIFRAASVISTPGGRGLTFFTSTGRAEGQTAHDRGGDDRRHWYWHYWSWYPLSYLRASGGHSAERGREPFVAAEARNGSMDNKLSWAAQQATGGWERVGWAVEDSKWPNHQS